VRAILALDQGTTSSRSLLFAEDGTLLGLEREAVEPVFPEPGFVEQDPEAIVAGQFRSATRVLQATGIDRKDVAAVGITNQRETVVLFERATGRPLAPAIVWQDRRTADRCAELRAGGLEALVRERTGLVIDPYFSATKIAWLLDAIPGARARAERGELGCGTIDAWLLFRLTGGAVFATDVSNASRTMLMDLRAGAWDDELCAILGVPRTVLPEIRPSAGHFGEVASGIAGAEALAGLPVTGIAGDQQAALAGQGCVRAGLAKCTYGTGCFLLEHVGDAPRASGHRLLSTSAWQVAGGPAQYALEGSVFVGGAVVQWLRDGLGVIDSAREVEALAASVPDAGGTYLVPAFAGLGAPHWDAEARGAWLGLTRGTTAGHLARAALEGIALSVADLADAMGEDAGHRVDELRVDGGATANDLLMGIQADVLGVPVVRPGMLESTALGAARLAAAGLDHAAALPELGPGGGEARFEPRDDPATRAAVRRLREGWRDAIDRVRGGRD